MKSTLSNLLFLIPLTVVFTMLLGLLHYASAGDIQTIFQQNYDASGEGIVEVKRLNSQSDYGIEAIGIERTVCFGTCPAYSFIVKTDGSFKYVGENYVDNVGEYTGTIPTFRLKKVLAAIEDLEFATLATQYTVGVTDMPTVYTMVVQNGQTKVIENYAGVAPARLWAIEELIDSLVDQIKWDEVEAADSY